MKLGSEGSCLIGIEMKFKGVIDMVKFIFGEKGSGKTKEMIDLANKQSVEAKGSVVYIDKNRNHIYDLDKSIRLVETGEFSIETTRSFYGFICGLISQNFDIETIFVDNQRQIDEADEHNITDFVKHLEVLNAKFGVKFIVSASRSEKNIPDSLRSYV